MRASNKIGELLQLFAFTLIGILLGAVALRLVPEASRDEAFLTRALGLIGSLAGGLLATQLFGVDIERTLWSPLTWLTAAAGSGILLAIWLPAARRRASRRQDVALATGWDALVSFPPNLETDEVLLNVEALLHSRGLAGQFSPIAEEAADYDAFGPREDGLVYHFITIARMNYALRAYGWLLISVDVGNEDHVVGAVQERDLEPFFTGMTEAGFETEIIPGIRWGNGDTFIPGPRRSTFSDVRRVDTIIESDDDL